MAPDSDLSPLLDDLAAEHDALDAVVAPLDPSGWDQPTPAAGWAVRHQISHLGFFDLRAAMAATDPAAFEAERDAMLADPKAFDLAGEWSALPGDELLVAWRGARRDLLAAFVGVDPRARLPWYGPPMSARSFLTARLMETWAHGTDVADAVGAALPATDRLRHIAHLGVVTRGWSYAVRGIEAPTTEVFVSLEPPAGGEPWTWGAAASVDFVTGPALDFCHVVTQRRLVGETALMATGGPAAEWLAIAQAFAGGATTTPPDRMS